MGLAVVLAYIALNLLSPANIFPSLSPYRPLLILAAASLPVAILGRLQSPELGKLRTQFILVSLFFVVACCSWFPHGQLAANLTTVFDLAPNVIAYFLAIVVLRSPSRLAFLRGVLVLIAIFVMLHGFLQISEAVSSGASTPYVLRGNIILGDNSTRIRGLGMLGDPNVFGQYLLMILPMLFVGKKNTGLGTGYLIAIPITVLFLIAVYYTGSRGAEMGVAVLIALYLIWRFKTVGAVFAAVGGALMLVAANAARTSRTITMSGGMDRLGIWSDGMSYFRHSPLFGIGFGEFTDRGHGMTAHNSYLLCAAELGMVGYFLWMSIIVVTIIQLSRVPKVTGMSNPALAQWAVALKLSLAVYLFTSFFLSRVYDLPLYLLFGMSGAVVAAAGGDEAVPLRGTMWQVWSLGLCLGILTLIYVMLRLRVAL
jgi:putative inorganic carbon (HCO3(-)) transporter